MLYLKSVRWEWFEAFALNYHARSFLQSLATRGLLLKPKPYALNPSRAKQGLFILRAKLPTWPALLPGRVCQASFERLRHIKNNGRVLDLGIGF